MKETSSNRYLLTMDKGKGKETRRLVCLVTSLQSYVEPLVIPEEEGEKGKHWTYSFLYARTGSAKVNGE